MKGLIATLSVAFLTAFVAAPANAVLVEDFERVEILDANGEVILIQELEPSNPLLIKTTHYYRLAQFESEQAAAKPGSGGSDPGTDCESDAYRVTGWFWDQPYSAQSESYASIVSGALGEWDGHTAADIAGNVGSGNNGNAGTYDGVNQLEWEFIGASSTIAVTTTWSYRGSGLAVESDGQYNEYYAWSTSGASNAMDVENIVQHEVGHTFGLDHPSGKGADCLTMYAYTNYGVTSGRTLGDGDILGIKAIYGA